jgi:hypothetical protein
VCVRASEREAGGTSVSILKEAEGSSNMSVPFYQHTTGDNTLYICHENLKFRSCLFICLPWPFPLLCPHSDDL